MAKKSRRSRFAEDAAMQALVRYGPEESGLKALAQQARADYGTSVRQAQTTGDLTLQAAREAIPNVAKIYDQAGLAQAKTASLVSPELAALSGPGAAVLQRGGALEVAQQLGNLRASRASALEDLNTRMVAARQGQQFGILNARQKFTSDMQKILGQGQSLRQQKGAFTASTLNALEQAALGRAVKVKTARISANASRANTKDRLATTRRGQDIAHQDRLTKLAADAAKKGSQPTLPGGVKPNTRKEHTAFKDSVARAVQQIKPFASGGKLKRSQLATMFLQGSPDGKIKPIPESVLTTALDQVLLGGISRGTAAKLHRGGYAVGQLGFRMAKPRPAVPRRSRRAAALVPGIGRGF